VARDHPEDIRRFTYAGWPRLTWSLEERAEGRDPIFPGRPQPMFQAANAFVRVNMAFTARKADVAKDAWLDVRRLVPPELLSTRDSSFSDVWAD
jgi:hypothetical protein